MKGPPKATLAKRAKSYSNFYDAAVQYLSKDLEKISHFDPLEAAERVESNVHFEKTFEDCEDGLLDSSQQEYQYDHDFNINRRELIMGIGSIRIN